MKNPKAIKLINKLIGDVEQNGIIINTVVEDLQNLRPYAVEEKRPLLAKTIRLVFEHIEAYQTFDIAIPDEEPVEGYEDEFEETEVSSSPAESLLYLLNLLAEPENKVNRLDLRAYVEAMQEYAEEH
ncbi:hypothetical protein [Leeuwenhoekiella palythoae]|uniref:Uncharacterized protein n=1 Tax=Leeuwenhoekiella palythoae TaxID=573501 RepID=A0A1M5XW72_9FLAO|nr:hypothetical protein [Leeuwenhoekiella palythoae]RXG30304.1 hypothetical protein DSM01_1054 [Leeuwenhoekiella palythoae]SHI04085.1 hypothetical protein SAMN04487999_1759 [Leeuwenhoekiella palythoae]